MGRVKTGSLIGGILLVAGTAIGGGMLALPVITAEGGFWPATVLYLLSWLFMASTGILLIEVALTEKGETNLVSMAKMTLGKLGPILSWVLYLFLFYSLSVAYISGGGKLIRDALEFMGVYTFPPRATLLLFVLIFAPFVILGAKAVGRFNILLMVGLLGSFFVFVVLGIKHVELKNFSPSNFRAALLATPVIFTSFAFQGIVPTLGNYLKRDVGKTKKAIWLGTTLPLLVYILWEWLILGVVPFSGLQEAFECGENSVFPLKQQLHLPWLYMIGEFFAFFAIVTSFLGVALGLFDFISDGLHIEKNRRGKLALTLFVFIPPLIISMIDPCLFLKALTFAGGFGCALLLGLIPILMAWRARYHLKIVQKELLPGGKIVLSLLLLFIVFELTVMVLKIV